MPYSFPAEKPVAIETHSADIIGLLNYLGIGRAAICGLSFGDSVLHDLMENYPQRIAGAYLAVSRTIQSLQQKVPVAVMKAKGHRRDDPKIPTLQSDADYHPITHQIQTELDAGQSTNNTRTVQQNVGQPVNMENVQDFNRQLLDFLINLAPGRKEPVMASLPFDIAAFLLEMG